MVRMAVLLSGSGRTLDNFHQRSQDGRLRAAIEVVVANVEGALGLKKAVHYGYPAYYAADGGQINRILADYQVDIVCLAGFLKLYSPPAPLARAVLNIHPSLIPSFCGEGYFGSRVHRAVLARGCTVSGCTVHFADDCYDQGPIVLQQAVDLAYDDDAEAIAAKVFAAECEAYPEAINRVGEMGIDYFWRRVGR
jgi:phosphoribosylglycinamide formyltransferase 1